MNRENNNSFPIVIPKSEGEDTQILKSFFFNGTTNNSKYNNMKMRLIHNQGKKGFFEGVDDLRGSANVDALPIHNGEDPLLHRLRTLLPLPDEQLQVRCGSQHLRHFRNLTLLEPMQ